MKLLPRILVLAVTVLMFAGALCFLAAALGTLTAHSDPGCCEIDTCGVCATSGEH